MQNLKCFVAGFGTVEWQGATSDFLKPGIHSDSHRWFISFCAVSKSESNDRAVDPELSRFMSMSSRTIPVNQPIMNMTKELNFAQVIFYLLSTSTAIVAAVNWNLVKNYDSHFKATWREAEMPVKVILVVHLYALMIRTSQFCMVQFHGEEHVQHQSNLDYTHE